MDNLVAPAPLLKRSSLFTSDFFVFNVTMIFIDVTMIF